MKHGVFSKQIVISSQAIGEDPKEFEDLLQKLWDHHQSVNIAEELQVEIIAVCLWRERRALRCELGEMGRAQMVPAEHDAVPITDPTGTLRLLKKVDQEIDKEGEFSDETKSMAQFFGWVVPRTEDLKELGAWQKRTLKEIRQQIRRFESMGEDHHDTEEPAAADCDAIPDAAALNRILKYKALNDRRLQRALTQLERLQRQRKGDYVPPPVKLSVDGSLGGE